MRITRTRCSSSRTKNTEQSNETPSHLCGLTTIESARSTPLDDVAPMIADQPQGNPDRRQGPADIREQIRLALAGMSAKAAEVFALRYFEGYGNHEIAKMLGTSRSTVNVILHRTRQKLREAIGPYVGEES